MSNILGRGFLVGLLFALILLRCTGIGGWGVLFRPWLHGHPAALQATLRLHRGKKSDEPIIYTGGYYMRTLVAGYEILGQQRYLDVATAYADGLVKKQMARGYWATGYGGVALADTGSAVGLFCVLYKHVDRERQEKYLAAVQRYIAAIEKDGFLHPSGAVGDGWETVKDGAVEGIENEDYTISTALTGGEVFTWMFHITKNDEYRRRAFGAISWILSTMKTGWSHPLCGGNRPRR